VKSIDRPAFIEYWSRNHLVVHSLTPKGRRTLCGNKVAKMLPARPEDIARALRAPIMARCAECVTAETVR
jgi:hypothetical protein